MVNLTFELVVRTKTDEQEISILVDEGYNGNEDLARIFIPSYFQGSEEFSNSQEIFLNSEECEALGKHLLAVSERLRRNEKG